MIRPARRSALPTSNITTTIIAEDHPPSKRTGQRRRARKWLLAREGRREESGGANHRLFRRRRAGHGAPQSRSGRGPGERGCRPGCVGVLTFRTAEDLTASIASPRTRTQGDPAPLDGPGRPQKRPPAPEESCCMKSWRRQRGHGAGPPARSSMCAQHSRHTQWQHPSTSAARGPCGGAAAGDVVAAE